ncbi:MAG TPA: ROK family protein [Anaerolineaceae bacterium]
MNPDKPTTRQLRRTNRSTLLKWIYFDGPISRLELSQRTELSPATATNLTSELLAEGSIVESGIEESEGGRPRTLLKMNPEYGYFIGVDVGETRVQSELFDLTLKRLCTVTHPLSSAENQPQQVVDHIVAGVNDLLTQANLPTDEVLGIGIGVPGLVAPASGVSVYAPNWGWHDVPFLAMLKEHLSIPIYLDNGAKVMALAESWLGAGRDIDSLAVLLVGTGIGAGIITNGSLYRGASNSAGEWGHITLELDGRQCRCGSRGCLEAYAGAQGIIQRYAEIAPASPFLQSGDQNKILAAIAEAAREGEPSAVQVLKDTARYLGVGVANLINMVNPELILLGGWVWLQIGDLIDQDLRQAIQEHALQQPFSNTTIGQCQLGQDAVPMGAATLPLKVFLETSGAKAFPGKQVPVF